MKKYLTLVVGFLAIFGLSSCTKEYYDIVPNTSYIYTINANQWTDNGNQISYDISLPELTDYFMNQGGVSVAMSFDNESTYNILPATFDAVAYSVNYSVGRVTIYGEDPVLGDFEVPIPDRVTVKIILSEADYVE
ncbi:hypothetical protein [Parapedobacter tibetensis]|uniref:hypothetical protein n=1 Tax=Parapedobacter tibetensis TaxID=2972951 RepID=UPI00214DE26B|nr:hypothetical protein [Parapedobacter tibetensis]